MGIVVAVIAAIQFVPVDTGNPGVVPSHSIYEVEPVPMEVATTLESSCSNCHSFHTVWPWYSRIAPASWLIAHDVHEGRAHLNFSEWVAYAENKREQKLEEICEQIVNGDMPDGKYLLVHHGARLSQEQKDAVCSWTESLR